MHVPLETVVETCMLSSYRDHIEHVEATCLVALVVLFERRGDVWYVDSGCSRHMTGDKSLFVAFSDEFTSESVTIGDRWKAKVMGKGIVNTPSIPNFQNVLFKAFKSIL